jgi:hypothetical protein
MSKGAFLMIESGDIVLFKGDSLIISRLIRWFTSSDYSHVGIAVNDQWIYEIDLDRKLAIYPLKRGRYDVYRYKHGLTEEQKRLMQTHALDLSTINEGYDWLRILSFVLQKVFRTKSILNWSNRVICSEITDRLYSYAGIDLVPDRDNGNVTPAQLAVSPALIQVYSSS